MDVDIQVVEVRGIGFWCWKEVDTTCHICFQLHEIPCPSCYRNGDKCPPIFGSCGHTFHYHCLKRWHEMKQNDMKCPLCRQDFQVVSDRIHGAAAAAININAFATHSDDFTMVINN